MKFTSNDYQIICHYASTGIHGRRWHLVCSTPILLWWVRNGAACLQDKCRCRLTKNFAHPQTWSTQQQVLLRRSECSCGLLSVCGCCSYHYTGTYVPHHPEPGPDAGTKSMPWSMSRSSRAPRLISFLTCYHFDLVSLQQYCIRVASQEVPSTQLLLACTVVRRWRLHASRRRSRYKDVLLRGNQFTVPVADTF